MQIIVPGGAFDSEVSGHNAARLFPYLADRLDAIKEIKDFEEHIGLHTRFGRKMLEANLGSNLRRIGSIPMHILQEAYEMYGDDFLHNREKLHMFFKKHPEWSTVK